MPCVSGTGCLTYATTLQRDRMNAVTTNGFGLVLLVSRPVAVAFAGIYIAGKRRSLRKVFHGQMADWSLRQH